jgi:hypothetical protein
MMHLAYHSSDAWIVLNFHNLGNLAKSQRKKSVFLINRSTDTALDLLNLNCCHDINPPN